VIVIGLVAVDDDVGQVVELVRSGRDLEESAGDARAESTFRIASMDRMIAIFDR
jgi:hypothetical protein